MNNLIFYFGLDVLEVLMTGQKITKAIVKILNYCNVKFAVLGAEESCTGDPAKRAGNEFSFMMQAIQNIELLKGYNIKKIVTGCPHCFNTLKNEYPDLGADFEVIHHTQLINQLIKEGKLLLKDGGTFLRGRKSLFTTLVIWEGLMEFMKFPEMF